MHIQEYLTDPFLAIAGKIGAGWADGDELVRIDVADAGPEGEWGATVCF
jgi:hypothetical protein